MADYDYTNLKLHARLVPDEESLKAHADSPESAQPTASLEVGVEIDGHFLPIFSHRSANDVLAAIERTKAEQPKKTSKA